MGSASTAIASASAFDLDPAARAAEHVELESEPAFAVDPGAARPVSEPFVISDDLRGCTTTLAFLEGHLLGVRSRRGGATASYWLDLRFLAPEPVLARAVAWRCLQAGLAFMLLGAALYAAPGLLSQPQWHAIALPGTIVCATVAACALALAWHRTRDTLGFHSLHGGVTLFEITTGRGGRRKAQVFEAELARRVQRARGEWGQPRTHHLRDEMREHHRLHTLGVLTEAQYEASKRRILGAHG